MNRLVEGLEQLGKVASYYQLLLLFTFKVIKLYKSLEQLTKKPEEMSLPQPLTMETCLKDDFIELLNTQITKVIFASFGLLFY